MKEAVRFPRFSEIHFWPKGVSFAYVLADVRALFSFTRVHTAINQAHTNTLANRTTSQRVTAANHIQRITEASQG